MLCFYGRNDVIRADMESNEADLKQRFMRCNRQGN